MKISSRLDYALSCAIILADMHEKNRPTPVALIAQRECIEYDYVEQILRVLKRGNIVKSTRGVNGGYVLAKPPEKITAKDIVIAMEKNSLQLVCERERARRKDCVHFNDCKVKVLWLGLRDNMEKYLNNYTLKRLLILRKKEKIYRNEKQNSLS
jgi:Rrf2 family transcriptional regulator, cysteine metabolism repressor